MQRNRRAFKLDEIRSIINCVAACCIAFPRCRHIYRNTIRLQSLLSSLAVAIIMTARKDAFIDFIGICYGKVPSLLLRTTGAETSFEYDSLTDLPEGLIKARIARGMTQKQLAESLNLQEQQIQRYEATLYKGAALERIEAVAKVLGLREMVRFELG